MFCNSVGQIHSVSWGVRREWFTLLDPEQCTLLVRTLRREKRDTVWSQHLAYYMPEDVLLQPDRQGETAFTYAANHHAFGTLEILLDRQPDAAFNPKGLLLPCMSRGHKALSKRIIDQLSDAELEERDEKGKDALDWAWQQWWGEITERLVSRLSLERLTRLDENKNSLLERAMWPFPGNVALRLIERLPPGSLQKLYRPHFEPDILEKATDRAGTPALMKLIEKLPNDQFFHSFDRFGYYRLAMAVAWGREKCIPALMQRICAGGSYKKAYRTLHKAAECGDVAVLQLLVGHLQGTDFAAQVTDEGKTALHLAIVRGHERAALFLVEHASPRALAIQDREGCTPLHLAVGQWSMAQVVYAIVAKSGPEILALADKLGWTPLHWAAKAPWESILHYFIEIASSTALDAVSRKGKTVLHLAIQQGLSESVIRAIMNKMTFNGLVVLDWHGRTVLHTALRQYQRGDELAVVLAVIEKMPQLHLWVEDIDGVTPIELAQDCLHQEILVAIKRKLQGRNLPTTMLRKSQSLPDFTLADQTSPEISAISIP